MSLSSQAKKLGVILISSVSVTPTFNLSAHHVDSIFRIFPTTFPALTQPSLAWLFPGTTAFPESRKAFSMAP